MLLSERIKTDGITCTSGALTAPPAEEINPDPDMQWYDVTLHMQGRTFSVPFGLGSGHTVPPETGDVMSHITMGVRSVYHNPGFTEWCVEWGFKPCDKTRLAMFRNWQALRDRLMIFLDGKFSAYMDSTLDDF